MAEDFGLEKQTDGTYALVGPTTDQTVRMANRFTVQFLSRQSGRRGSLFLSELSAGRVKTNSDVVSLFALTVSQILSNMRRLAQDIAPVRARLDSFSFLDNLRTIRLTYTVITTLGTVQQTVTVGDT